MFKIQAEPCRIFFYILDFERISFTIEISDVITLFFLILLDFPLKVNIPSPGANFENVDFCGILVAGQ